MLHYGNRPSRGGGCLFLFAGRLAADVVFHRRRDILSGTAGGAGPVLRLCGALPASGL